MSLTFKLLSLAIRTAAKPIGNYIKRQAKEHDGFRRFAVAQAQRVHRIDMRMRLGILHDAAAQERMHERERKAEEDKKRRLEAPTVRNEEEQKKHDEQKAKEESEPKGEPEKRPVNRVKIKPLSEARAIELGANFFSETFIFAVAAGLLIWDSWRSRRKETARRDDVAERLEQLEAEVESLRATLDPDLETLHDLSERIKAAKAAKQASWWNPVGWIPGRSLEDTAIMEESRDQGKRETAEPVVPIRKLHQQTSSAADGNVAIERLEKMKSWAKEVEETPSQKIPPGGKASEEAPSSGASSEGR